MTRTLKLGLCSLVVGLLVAGPLLAQDSPLAHVPAKSPIVVQVKGVERTKGRLMATLKNALPDLGFVLQPAIEAGLQKALDGRDLMGLDPNGPIFLVFADLPQAGDAGPPDMAVVARVKSYKEFRDGFLTKAEQEGAKRETGYEIVKLGETEVYLVDRKDYAVIASNKDVATAFTKNQPGLDTKLDKDLARRLLEPDLAVYVDTAAVNKEYGDQIKGIQQQIELVFQQGAGAGLGGGKGQLDAMKKALDIGFQAFQDSQALIASLEFRPEGLAIHAEIAIAKDSKTNNFLKPLKPSTLEALTKLPAGQLSYSAVEVDPMLARLFQSMAAAAVDDADGERRKVMEKALDKLEKAESRLWVDASNANSQGLKVSFYANPTLATEGRLELFKAMTQGGAYGSMAIKGAQIKENAQTHRNFKLHHAKMEWDLDKLTEQLPIKEMGDAFKKLFGEGVETWFGTDGKVYVEVSAKDWDAAKAFLDRYLDQKGTVGQEKGFMAARKNLPAEATMVSLIHAPMYAQIMAEFLHSMAQAFPLPLGKPPMPAKAEPTYLGAAITLQSGHASMDIWIPGTAVREFRKTFEPMIRPLIPGGGLPE